MSTTLGIHYSCTTLSNQHGDFGAQHFDLEHISFPKWGLDRKKFVAKDFVSIQKFIIDIHT